MPKDISNKQKLLKETTRLASKIGYELEQTHMIIGAPGLATVVKEATCILSQWCVGRSHEVSSTTWQHFERAENGPTP
jgi:hypothetical protein